MPGGPPDLAGGAVHKTELPHLFLTADFLHCPSCASVECGRATPLLPSRAPHPSVSRLRATDMGSRTLPRAGGRPGHDRMLARPWLRPP